MRLDALPAHAATKLLTLDQEHRTLAAEREEIEKKVLWCRQVFNHKIEDPDLDERKLYAEFPALQAREAEVSRRASAAKWVSEHARRWVEQLGDDVVLETAAVKVPDGADLGGVRRRMVEAKAEVAVIERTPSADPNIRAKVEAYVAGLNEDLQITGIQAGETLVIGRRPPPMYGMASPATAEQVAALLWPEQLADALMARIEALADGAVPPKDRPARLAALVREVEQLQYCEEALITAAVAAGEAVTRSTDAPPAAVLGVRVKARAAPAPEAATDAKRK
jgi:hypothetical protein